MPVRQQKLELAHRSQLDAQTLSKVHEVRFPLALNKRLTGQEPMLYAIERYNCLALRRPGSGAFLRIAAIGFNSTLAGHL